MSLTHSEHIEPARTRHGAHYKLRPKGFMGPLRPAMIFHVGDVSPKDKICGQCFRTPLSNDTEICPRCGGKIE